MINFNWIFNVGFILCLHNTFHILCGSFHTDERNDIAMIDYQTMHLEYLFFSQELGKLTLSCFQPVSDKELLWLTGAYTEVYVKGDDIDCACG